MPPGGGETLGRLFLVEGRSVETVAERTGRTESSVITRLSRLGMLGGIIGNCPEKRAAAMVELVKDTHYIRCLGIRPLEREHRFVSSDPKYVRVCTNCRRRMMVESID